MRIASEIPCTLENYYTKILPLWYKGTQLPLLSSRPLSIASPTFPLIRSDLFRAPQIGTHRWTLPLLWPHKHPHSHLSKASVKWVGFTFHTMLFPTFHIPEGSQVSSHLPDLQSINCLYKVLENRSRHHVTLVKYCLVKESTILLFSTILRSL